MATKVAAAKPFRVVVLGAGFGGLEATRALARAPVEVTLVDRQNHHLFQPLLYQVATAALSPGDVAWPVRTVFRRQRNATVVMAEATGVDTEARVARAACPDCRRVSTAPHGSYTRRPSDPSSAGREVRLALRVRRLTLPHGSAVWAR